jgi:holo-[acyl-carrier protein] synthase
MSTSPEIWPKVSLLNKNYNFIYGVGTDIIEVSRIRSALEKYPGFKTRVYTEHEVAFCEDKKNETAKYISYAERFAAKEALAKALGTGLGKDIFFKDIEVQNMPSGQPLVKLSQKAQELLIKKGPFDLKISLSGTKELAIAFVIIFCNQIFNKQS